MKYLHLLIICFPFTLHNEVESEIVNRELEYVIREELSTFLDTVKAVTMCQVWIPGREGEPYVYFIKDEFEYTIQSKLDSVIAGENVLKINSFTNNVLFTNEATLIIPYILIDYIEFQPYGSNEYIGSDITLYLSGLPGQ